VGWWWGLSCEIARAILVLNTGTKTVISCKIARSKHFGTGDFSPLFLRKEKQEKPLFVKWLRGEDLNL
jgi:hypothetical protein